MHLNKDFVAEICKISSIDFIDWSHKEGKYRDQLSKPPCIDLRFNLVKRFFQ